MPDQAAPFPTTLATDTSPPPSHFESVEALSRDLKHFLDKCDVSKLKSELRAELEQLAGLTDTWREGLAAASQIRESAAATLAEARKEIDLAYQQMLTLEDEGGNPATPRQQRDTEDLSKALRRVNNLIPAVAQATAAEQPSEPDMQPPEQEPGVPPEVSPPIENPASPPETQPIIPPVIDPKM